MKIKVENEIEREIESNISLKDVIFFITIPIVIIALMILFLDLTMGIYYRLSRRVICLTLFMLILIHLFLTLLTGNARKSLIIQLIILVVAIFINFFRFLYTTEPFSFADFAYIFNLSGIVSIVRGDIISEIISCIPYIFLIAYIIGIYMFLTRKYNFCLKINIKKRILLSLIPLCALIFLFAPPKWFRDIILNKFYYPDSVNKHTLNIEYYLEDSMLGGMYMLHLENRVYKPNGYNKEEVEEMLGSSKTADSNWEKANIIVTFSESFFDVSLLEDDITFDKEVTSNFNSLKEEGIFINMISPTYGGVSSNVEFQLLTGNTLDFFSTSYVPFMTIYKNAKSANNLSLIKELKNNGYYTKVVFGRDYYISESVYKNLGIDEYEEKDIESQYKGYFTSDEYLMDETIRAFNEKESGQKLFYMNCTIQSHQTFELEKYDTYDINIKSSTLDEGLANTVLSYAQGAYDADQQLRKNV